MATYIGNVPVPQASQTRDRFVATAGQTSFPTSGYTAGYLDVYLNGVKLDSTDYTATNGSDVVLTAGATADDIIEVVAFSTFEIGSNVDNASVATQSLVVDRQSTDGTIIDLQKDGTAVGSIGTFLNQITVGKGSTGMLFNGSTKIYPWNVATNSNADNQMDLGTTSTRFKDLYLSGGVYLGGTGSANHLDDYEEGTFTPVMTGVSGWLSTIGKYTKIGNMVHFHILFSSNSGITGTPSNVITGLPFTEATGERQANVSISRQYNVNLTNTDYIAGVFSASVLMSFVNGNNSTNNFTISGTTLRFSISGTYQTDA